jgi:hypothetical protein
MTGHNTREISLSDPVILYEVLFPVILSTIKTYLTWTTIWDQPIYRVLKFVFTEMDFRNRNQVPVVYIYLNKINTLTILQTKYQHTTLASVSIIFITPCTNEAL